MTPPGVLGEIVARTRARVHVKHRERPLERLLGLAPTPVARRSFEAALTRPGGIHVIAEFKRRSPSKGVLRADLHPVRVAQGYEIAGAAAVSVLTEEEFFGGSLDDLQQVRAATMLPALRKDFVVDPYQVWEAWIAGADALLLIVAALEDDELRHLLHAAHEASLAALVEVHDERELRRALDAGARLVGVNNRDLTTLQVDVGTAVRLAPLIPDDVVAVAESGLRTGADLLRMHEAGFDAVLVGEHLMTSPDPGEALEHLIAGSRAAEHGRGA